jgi:hypothetical protein
MQLMILPGAVVAFVLVGFSIRHFLRRRRDVATLTPMPQSATPPLSAVRLLRGEQEIQAAITLAAGMEQQLLAIAERRYAQYRTSAAREPIMLRRPVLDQSA